MMNMKSLTPEKEFVLQVIHYLNPNYERINELINQKLDWNLILGMIEFHRLGGLVYYVLNSDKINHETLHRPIMFGLGMTYEAFLSRISAMNEYIIELNNALVERNIKAAFLKGSILSNIIYPWGCRASSDIDILINASDIDKVDEVLRELGYIQGEYNFVNKEIVEFSRFEVIFRRMNWGEVAMYHKNINRPCADKVTIDVNFSLNWHPYETKNTVNDFLNNITLYASEEKGISIYSLQRELFLLQLCIHAFKEVNLYKMVQMRQDLELYKFVDIYTFLLLDYVNWDEFILLVKKYNFKKECYLVFKYIESIFFNIKDHEALKKLLYVLKPQDDSYLEEVFDPTTNRLYRWNNSLLERLFDTNHKKHLVEIEGDNKL